MKIYLFGKKSGEPDELMEQILASQLNLIEVVKQLQKHVKHFLDLVGEMNRK